MEITIQLAIIGGIITLITGGLASIPGILALRSQKKKTNAEANKTEADAAQTVQNMALELIEPYRKRVNELESMIITSNATLKQSNQELAERVDNLETALAENFECLLEVSDCAHRLYDQLVKIDHIPECEPPSREALQKKKEALEIRNGKKK